MPEDFRALLILPQVGVADRSRRQQSIPRMPRVPEFGRQVQRIGPVFNQLQQAFNARQATFQQNPQGTAPEQVLVFETAVSIKDFFNTVKRIEGLEWLAEWETEFDPDDDFCNEENPEKPIGGRLFLVMVNHQALNQLLALWRRYCDDPAVQFERGLNRWKELFATLRSIRPWGVEDRLRDTGIIEDWQERLIYGEETVQFEAEFWFRSNHGERQRAERNFQTIANLAGGQIISTCVIEDICYHGVLAEFPITEIQRVQQNQDVQFLSSDQVMFFRPVGQANVDESMEEPSDIVESPIQLGALSPEPIVAILDGLPMENHPLLSDRIVVDDRDGYSDDYQANERKHGTWMSSLVIHGQLDMGDVPLNRPVYVRPILKPDNRAFTNPRPERMPVDRLPIDVVHQAVREIFEGQAQQAAAPSVKIINFSIGDPCRLFDRALSSWARLLDWLAWRYKVLFIVSAGNHADNITLNFPKNELQTKTPIDMEAAVIASIANDMRNRRLLSPAESVNALTVGAMHGDGCQGFPMGYRLNPYTTQGLPSPCSAIGLGYRRAVKPDVLLTGGRQFFMELLPNNEQNAIVKIAQGISAQPGLKVAGPSSTPGSFGFHYICGTSCAAALATHSAGELHENILTLRNQRNGELLRDEYIAVLLKTMLVHGASWPEAYDRFADILKNDSNRHKFREFASRFFGFGITDPTKLRECTFQRATLIGCGELANEQAHEYLLPLPPSLSGQREWRRLTVTLSWFTPTSPTSQRYRKAALWFECNNQILRANRQEADARSVQRGTVQHEIFEGTDALAYVDGDSLYIKVNCREDAGRLRESIPYALAVSLEVRQGVQIPIYDEIKARIAVPVQIRT